MSLGDDIHLTGGVLSQAQAQDRRMEGDLVFDGWVAVNGDNVVRAWFLISVLNQCTEDWIS